MSQINTEYKFNLPVILGISGASGFIYGLRTLEFLLENKFKVDLVLSKSAIKVAREEMGLDFSDNSELLYEQIVSYLKIKNYEGLNTWAYSDISASISSGSYKTQGMIIIPCSMGTVSAIAHGASDNLISRAADVCIKEKRKLILVPREMPMSPIHLENLHKLSTIGVTIAPACPGFYHSPKTVSEMVDFVVGKVLDSFGIDHDLFVRWTKSPILK